MKLVEGNFKGPKKPPHAGQRLLEQIKDSGILDMEYGVFTVCFDAGHSICILSNAEGPGNVLLNFKKAEMAIMAQSYCLPDDPKGGAPA